MARWFTAIARLVLRVEAHRFELIGSLEDVVASEFAERLGGALLKLAGDQFGVWLVSDSAMVTMSGRSLATVVEDVWFPGAEDLVIFSLEAAELILVSHEEEILLARV